MSEDMSISRKPLENIVGIGTLLLGGAITGGSALYAAFDVALLMSYVVHGVSPARWNVLTDGGLEGLGIAGGTYLIKKGYEILQSRREPSNAQRK